MEKWDGQFPYVDDVSGDEAPLVYYDDAKGYGSTLNGSADLNGGGGKNGMTNLVMSDPIPPSAVLGLDYAFFQVRDMVKLFDQPHPTEPTMITEAMAARRSKWIKSECDELTDATTLEDQADAYMDILVFGLGGLVEMGVLPQSLLDIVNAANMAKAVIDEDGKLTVVKDAEGKVQKPAGWKENFEPQPRIVAEIARQKAAGLLLAASA